jgi:hypothetical protein
VKVGRPPSLPVLTLTRCRSRGPPGFSCQSWVCMAPTRIGSRVERNAPSPFSSKWTSRCRLASRSRKAAAASRYTRERMVAPIGTGSGKSSRQERILGRSADHVRGGLRRERCEAGREGGDARPLDEIAAFQSYYAGNRMDGGISWLIGSDAARLPFGSIRRAPITKEECAPGNARSPARRRSRSRAPVPSGMARPVRR